MDAKDKVADTTNPSARFEQEGRERVDDALHAQTDMTSQKAVKEASRLGGGDTYLVETDLEEADESEGVENADGSISALANAGNQER
ncbi:MAG: hypothetical protein KJ947_02680 [Alphaproteobacteria bacterium]|uniref:hypothetical protein n=1 Tax=Pseudorhizobium pelagicum TaxID=1509405 RepID=UPI00178D65A8|nr:hypothetical protein [Hyphomicrobiales bacterium]MBU1316614.1 hypothetical protein [Alphaproteobacteria bacterium]MBU1548467.1 hypothetical protein [Alphaproteobacteria bacterium]MBU2335771.1 hypothetical protein [Alphaproteobacteria bacterium]MBU2390834.1 hypothetical protein [Alphaproteobacteria bacterium]